jgi:hypothetical protein
LLLKLLLAQFLEEGYVGARSLLKLCYFFSDGWFTWQQTAIMQSITNFQEVVSISEGGVGMNMVDGCRIGM